MRKVGKNVVVYTENDIEELDLEKLGYSGECFALILVDLSKDFGPSSTGKNTIVASTQGGKRFSEELPGFRLNMTLYKE